jgi:hypothetical protein
LFRVCLEVLEILFELRCRIAKDLGDDLAKHTGGRNIL